MNVSSVDGSSTMPVPAVAVTTPKQGHSRPVQASDGNVEVNKEEMKKMVAEMQSHLNSMNVSLQFTPYGDHGEKVAIAVINKETGEVIREIPPKEIQDLYSRMTELAGKILHRQI
jgi:flagellar protein FlaG